MTASRSIGAVTKAPSVTEVLLLAALVAWATVLLTTVTWYLATRPGDMTVSVESASRLFATAFVGLLVSVLLTILTGLPALAFARLLKLQRWWQASTLGSAVGALLVVSFPGWSLTSLLGKEMLVQFAFAGGLSGFVVWVRLRMASKS